MKKLLITGAAGFVGKNLISFLINEKIINELIIVDKLHTPRSLSNKLETSNLIHRTFVSSKIPRIPDVQDVDTIICLAGSTSVDAALKNPKKAINENIAIAIDLAEWVRCVNPAVKIIYISSDEVLGASVVPLSENAPLNPTQPYAISKASAEMILHNYRDIYGLNILTLRSCNLVGFGQKKPKLIPMAVQSLLNNQPVPIHGDGNQLREWMAVEDLCRAIILLLQDDITPQIFQATSGVKISVNNVVKIVADKLGVDLQICYVTDRLVQDESYAMQATRLNILGWQPISNPHDAIRFAASLLAEQIPH